MGKPKRLTTAQPSVTGSESVSPSESASGIDPQQRQRSKWRLETPAPRLAEEPQRRSEALTVTRRSALANANGANGASGRFEDLPSIAIPSDDSRTARVPVAVRTEQSPEEGEQKPAQLEDVPLFYNIYKGLPSWLTSLAFHMALIVLLALLVIGDNSKGTVNLTAVTIQSDEPILALNTIFDEQEPSEQELLDDPEQLVAEETEETPDFSLEQQEMEAPEFEADLFGAHDELTKVAGNDNDGSPNPSGTEEGAEFFGVSGEGSDFVFIIDCSGSMADYGRWKRALNELTLSIKGLSSRQNFLVLLYNNNYVPMNNPPQMIPATRQAQGRAIDWLNNRFPDGWTFCSNALKTALEQKPDAIFLLSDGEFTDRGKVLRVLTKNNPAKSDGQQTPIHTIALGSHVGRFTMKHIAENNNGIFTLISDN